MLPASISLEDLLFSSPKECTLISPAVHKDQSLGKKSNNSFCVSDSCVENQILKQDGTCEDCDDYTHPDTSVRNCIQCDMTGRDRDIWTLNGQCYTCEDYTYPGPMKHECMTDECDEEREFKLKNGTCYECPENTYPDQATGQCM